MSELLKRKRILSGIQPTGTPTLGNYLGPCATGRCCRTAMTACIWWPTCTR